MNISYARFVPAASLCAVLLAGCNGGTGANWIGVMLGDPTGVSYRMELSRAESVAAGLDVGRLVDDVLHFHVDYLIYTAYGYGSILPYIGVGVDVAAWSGRERPFGAEWDGTYVAARVPLGIDIALDVQGMYLFLQIVPKVPLTDPALHFDAALGILFAF